MFLYLKQQQQSGDQNQRLNELLKENENLKQKNQKLQQDVS